MFPLRVIAVFAGVCMIGLHAVSAAPLRPEHVAVVYNGNVPEGRALALEYMQLRGIPDENLVVLYCPTKENVSREEYNRTILGPLRNAAREKGWWAMSGNREKPFLRRNIYAAVLISGIPLKIDHEPRTPGEKPTQANTNGASVESELAFMAVEGVPLERMVANPYFQKDGDIVGSDFPVLLLSRLDSPSPATTRRMMRDAVAVEKKGLWGWVVIDRGGPHKQGDMWLDDIEKEAVSAGLACVKDTSGYMFPRNYPLSLDTAVYFGWYGMHVSGPFLDPDFRFRPGAVAVHIHSFSASTIRTAEHNWCGPLLDRGAAVTLGNVREPFLTGSHYLNIFFDRLLKGYTVVEAAAMSMPVLSWQSTVLGDPLYRPFAVQSSGRVVKDDRDKYFQAWWMAQREWGGNPAERRSRLEKAAKSTEAGTVFWEALAYEARREKRTRDAEACFDSARDAAVSLRDKARIDMEKAALLRQGNEKGESFRGALDRLIMKYEATPYVESIREWRKRAEPKPPKPAAK